MGCKEEISDIQVIISFFQYLVRRNYIPIRFGHLLAVHIYELMMHPVFDPWMDIKSAFRLSYLIGMMNRDQIISSMMDIKLISKIFAGHCTTFSVPTWESHTSRTFPFHIPFAFTYMEFPQCEIGDIFLSS